MEWNFQGWQLSGAGSSSARKKGVSLTGLNKIRGELFSWISCSNGISRGQTVVDLYLKDLIGFLSEIGGLSFGLASLSHTITFANTQLTFVAAFRLYTQLRPPKLKTEFLSRSNNHASRYKSVAPSNGGGLEGLDSRLSPPRAPPPPQGELSNSEECVNHDPRLGRTW